MVLPVAPSRFRHLGSSVRGWRRITPGPHPWWAAAVATAAPGLPLAVTLAAHQPLLAAPATFGAMANLYGRHEPYAHRWRTQAWTGLGLTAAVLLGGAAAALPLGGWLGVLVPALLVAVVAVVAKFVTDAVRTGPPAGLIPVFAAGTLTAAPVRFPDLPLLAVVTLTSAALAAALSGAAGLRRPDGPERNAAARALRSVLAAVEDPRLRARASADLHAAWGVLVLGPAGRTGRHGAWLAHAERVLDAGAPAGPLRAALPALAGRGALPPAPVSAGVLAELRGREHALPRCRPPPPGSGTPTGPRSAPRPPCSRRRRGSPPSAPCSGRRGRCSGSPWRPRWCRWPPTPPGCGC